ncbi:hypothetical protein C7402_109313 [Paraburkholderia unamae]|uniref:Uncharacterized protein n=1 Tax=Paraburkholderia unamae TaxID=219649 RepID=A0ABX5KKR3_9BURK|nr:hypothetical protein C7402_109313 [Paraburkholderia unamae]
MFGDTEWFTFFPASARDTRRIANGLRRLSPVNLSEATSLEVTAKVFGYASYANLLEYLAFDWGYPHKWDEDIDEPTMTDRVQLQAVALKKCLNVTIEEARNLLKLWRPSSRHPSATWSTNTERMNEAKRELERFAPRNHSDYMDRLADTFRPQPPLVMKESPWGVCPVPEPAAYFDGLNLPLLGSIPQLCLSPVRCKATD